MKTAGRSNMKTLAVALALALTVGPAAADKLYKWTDKDGNVHYTDQPPPPEAKSSERKKFGDHAPEGTLPYSLKKAVKDFPVTLYTADCGDPCSRASAALTKRGVPYTEKNPREGAAAEELKALTGGKIEIPVMKVGSQVLRGYDEENWKNILDAAGYPTSALVPVAASKAAAQKPKPDATSTQSQMSIAGALR
jgi:glutaredoxin